MMAMHRRGFSQEGDWVATTEAVTRAMKLSSDRLQDADGKGEIDDDDGG
jgi:hypothetical protein